jgi:hypothetical protein
MKKLVLIPILALSLSGCNTTELTFSQSETRIAAIFWGSDTAQVIQIGSVDDPYAGSPAVAVRVDGKVILDSTRLSPEVVSDLVAQHQSRGVAHAKGFGQHPSSRSLRSDRIWGEKALSVDLLDPSKRGPLMPYDEARRQDISVIVKSGAVRAIRIVDFRSDPTKNPIEIRIGNSSWVNSRLSQGDCIDLFGEPTKEQKYLTE